MWNLKDIKIQDFFSHVDSEYSFHNDCCTLIVGDNKDRGGNNGAGKTNSFYMTTNLFLSGIVVLLYGNEKDLPNLSFVSIGNYSFYSAVDLTLSSYE